MIKPWPIDFISFKPTSKHNTTHCFPSRFLQTSPRFFSLNSTFDLSDLYQPCSQLGTVLQGFNRRSVARMLESTTQRDTTLPATTLFLPVCCTREVRSSYVSTDTFVRLRRLPPHLSSWEEAPFLFDEAVTPRCVSAVAACFPQISMCHTFALHTNSGRDDTRYAGLLRLLGLLIPS